MSCYNWERGTIKLPSAVYASFRKEFIVTVCVRERQDFDRCVKVVDAFRRGQVKPQADQTLFDALREALFEEFHPQSGRSFHDYGEGSMLDLWSLAHKLTHDAAPHDCGRVDVPRPAPIPRKSTRALTKALYPLSSVSKTRSFTAEGATVRFDDAQKSLTWDVSENNHAVEQARASFLGKTLFTMLARVSWSRGSGGQIVGNDEYRREDSCAGGGANYVTAEFGPNMKASSLRRFL